MNLTTYPSFYHWLAAFLWLIIIYCTIPVARMLQGWIAGSVGRIAFIWVVVFFLLLLLFLAIKIIIRRTGKISFSRAGVLFLVLTLYGLFIWRYWGNPERTMHIVQYGFLSILVYRALTFSHTAPLIYIYSTLFCLVAGTVDELIQWATPGRFFDYEDIFLNFASAALVQLAICFAIRPIRR